MKFHDRLNEEPSESIYYHLVQASCVYTYDCIVLDYIIRREGKGQCMYIMVNIK